MFFRNGEALGSVRTEPKVEPTSDPEPRGQEDALSATSTSTERPKDYDNKPEWVEYAVFKGASRDEAEGLTKPELIELYGGEE